MRYITIFNADSFMSMAEIAKEWDEWVDTCRSEILHHGCRDIQRYETTGDMPHKLFFLIEADDLSVTDLLRDHFGSRWRSETYQVHLTHDLKEDHAVVAG